MKRTLALAITAALFSAACASTSDSSVAASPALQTKALQTQAYQPSQAAAAEGVITLEQIMADPDWLARSPENAFWSLDGSRILFQQKQQGAPIRSLFAMNSDGSNLAEVAFSELHEASSANRIYNAERSQAAYIFERNIFVVALGSGELVQLTRDNNSRSDLQFLTDGRLSYRQGNDFYAINVSTGRTEMLASLVTSDAATPVRAPADYLAKEEVELMLYNQVQRRNRQLSFDHQQSMRSENPSTAPAPFYLGRNQQIVEASLSPAGDKLIVALTDPQSWRGDSDLMPRYVTETGRIEMQDVRRRVADAKPVEHKLFVLDLESGEKHALSYTTLPGYDEDVLRSVHEENYAARGETYRSERKPRAIGVMPRWSAQQGNVVWRENGEEVALMLRAWDNKDRWIATVNFNDHSLVSQHRLHDDAWINRNFNDLGWLPGQRKIWYSSEESGYGHLYVRDLERSGSNAVTALTQGNYIVEQVTLNQAGTHFYFQANKTHPGVYEIYRVAATGGELEQLTEFGGITSYVLSPDESQLLLTYSDALTPTELYVQANEPVAEAMRLTHTVSEQFESLPWQAPSIVAVPSSKQDHPIYSRVYYPENYDPSGNTEYPAVVFIHGAGYLQNAHAGWSNYFREFMFHNMLLQQGYIVLDLDFRGSKGYGRDWRTAVYRQMGTPEVEDLVDVVNWMGENANVDVERVGTYGGSYGGFLTFMALFNEPGLFKAGAALRPVTDWAHYNTGYTSNILNLPENDPIAYRRSSPIYFAEGLEDALLISAPMVDDNVFFQDSVRIVQRFIELEKENFETAIFPVEPHGFVQPSSWLNQYRKIFKLFEENLKP
ncbi:prolyl oligopeptidase family serine peptidase [Aliidiomarina celeris]|uniref:prolyl oligopeptidase family serine peptidase n=1 Tax=Aliidiomarina celeris TaxID=2249428 RepID=UPI0018E6234A|nr:prolyl oligopeptidase family serine peptidase [Aliidiomarina celeris]